MRVEQPKPGQVWAYRGDQDLHVVVREEGSLWVLMNMSNGSLWCSLLASSRHRHMWSRFA